MQKDKSFLQSFQNLREIFLASTKLGLTSFGGPIAHLGYFHEEYVRKRKWLDEKTFAELVALCQFLPGPASSQVGIGIGVVRAGVLGGAVSFLGFTLPSVLILMFFAMVLHGLHLEKEGFIHGLKLVAVAVVAQAILGMARTLTPDPKRQTIALFAMVFALLWQTSFTQIAVILFSALLGIFLFSNQVSSAEQVLKFPISRRFAAICLIIFFGLLVFLPVLRGITSSQWVAMFDSFYRSGALVFGGGHVVLPLLEQEVVPTGWISKEAFLTGYGAAQAVPGPLFTFASYLGAVINGWKGGLIATAAIFLPAFLLIYGTLPFWSSLRQNSKIRAGLMGVNAAVVGLLVAAFYQPIWHSSILTSIDFAIASVLFGMLVFWKVPPWVAVLLGAILGTAIW